jgi:tetratricopeptide (TPR) repeat protein
LASYYQAIALKPDDAVSHYNSGVALNDLNRLEAAVASYHQAIALQPDYADAYNNRGNALRDLKQPEAALASYRQAITLKPDYAEAYYNCGLALRDIKQAEAVLAAYDRAIALKPDYVAAYCNRGNAFRDLKRFDEAYVSYDRAIAIKPDYAKAYWHKSLLKLLLGDYDAGWQLYEWRWKTASFINTVRNYQQPLWLGEQALTGKTLLIYGEQGLGDSIQFCRYAPMAQARGAKVILEAPRELFALLSSLKGNVTLIEQGHQLPDFDLHCPLMSLPLAFKTTVPTIPAEIPYLYSDTEKQAVWHKRLGAKTKLRVGSNFLSSFKPVGMLTANLPSEVFPLTAFS